VDDTDPIQKAQGKAILQNAIAIDAMVQCMSKMDELAYWKGMEDMTEHAESLSIYRHHHLKRLYNGLTKDLVEEI
jgi:hypothetical protein